MSLYVKHNISRYFGFTSDEVKNILKYYGIEDKYSLFKEWYDGYKFGNTGIYCPWDVINQCIQFISDSNAKMKSYMF
ncbi:MAG: AAA family ATPase [Lachnospiraceae bacterium]